MQGTCHNHNNCKIEMSNSCNNLYNTFCPFLSITLVITSCTSLSFLFSALLVVTFCTDRCPNNIFLLDTKKHKRSMSITHLEASKCTQHQMSVKRYKHKTYRISCIFRSPKPPRPLLVHFRPRRNTVYESNQTKQINLTSNIDSAMTNHKNHKKQTHTNSHVEQLPRPHHDE